MKADTLFCGRQLLQRVYIAVFILIVFTVLIPAGAKARDGNLQYGKQQVLIDSDLNTLRNNLNTLINKLNKKQSNENTNGSISINENLFHAAFNLDGVDRKLCLFVAIDSSPRDNEENGQGQEPNLEADFPIAWLQSTNSLIASRSGLSVNKVKDAVIILESTPSGANLFQLLEKAGIRERYKPITIHVAKTSSFINSDLPVAFNSLITIRDQQKAFPFIVFNQDAIGGKYISERKISVILANELFDVLGRLVLGDDITATSDYQALGIILSDITLDKEIRDNYQRSSGNSNLQRIETRKSTKQEIVNLFNKALNDYSSFVPPLEESFMSDEEKNKLDSLTSFVSSGVFNNFSELKSMSVDSANYVAKN